MGRNRLKLNPMKTQFLLVGTWQQLSRVKQNSINLNGTEIGFSDAVSNLGFIFDKYLTMDHHVTSLVKECSFQLCQLRQIRKCLDRNGTHLLVQAFVTARLDYCNSLLYGISDKQLNKLQIIQNQTAKLITGEKKFGHVTPVLKSLHWLPPVKERILFKLGVLVFKCLNNLG